jgi:gluconate 2-dehydrogenase gamma chain
MGRDTDKTVIATPRDPSRRDLFRQAGAAGAAVAIAAAAPPTTDALAQHAGPPLAPAVPRREARENLTAAEADMLEAIVARLIPTDENGPGAAEARAVYYIDRALTGPLRGSRETYADGLAALDVYAESTKGAPFAKLQAPDQDAVLSDLERNIATGFSPNAATFFTLLRTHTIQGTFCDPYYGGNADFIGWDLIGYPGLRMTAAPEDQRMAVPKAVRASAYDEAMFTMKGKTGGGRDH